ncbi:N-acetyltransferase eso1 [Echria macrotheca]|uniref:DNA polymerase eta n=1 Tax=Echria macrotheca TaxID=438768 RepID=A0AAJ0FCI1_9PEZI|nr:N-acetyltransferase eso1 [Echria macrotheca]
MPSTTALDWQADALVDVNENAELVDPDWDDVAMLIGSEIVRDVRQAIREKLHYTCSAGIAKNKLLSKLGSAHKKPNQQTVIPNRAIQHFLSGFKFTKMRNLGGKLGEEVSRVFETDQVSDLLSITVEQFKLKLGDDTGTWVYNTIRGIDTSEVNARTQIKSMLSAKSFRPSVTTVEQATKWLRIFAADIFSRLVEEGVLENKRRPKTINLHFRHGGQTRSRQGPIPQGRPLEEETLFELAKSLLSQIVQEGDVWPCSNLSLSIGGFEEGITGNMGIAAFLVKGEEAQALRSDARSPVAEDDGRPAEKRRRTDDGGIQRFFMKKETSSDQASEAPELGSQHTRARNGTGDSSGSSARDVTSGVIVNPKGSRIDESDDGGRNREDTLALWLRCPRCDAGFEDPDALQSHEDWHFAKDLQEEERGSRTLADRPAPASSTRTGASRNASAPPKRPGRPKKTERGQSRLNFG